ncbi:FHS family L-fucose permease-like MFS transporter [Parabacteroides sp. PF5-5]|uniref:L-fucose:H+ symporter permease n=1 Tax=unclassified Parabacteroides TaxID=2649774 RepID=UPI002475F178|nr:MULTISPECIES: L-fucose:H+ symporter permease [unclassified Parabacteroides]MDH6305130.1 FHS family L-fucose permease-like MFS transporter [Parabacteroides sp. PH5-39]MDH6316480.1 FHS family L-fucose permease-like MFS transporter [Parabacteroides sp. PF5-13]MDH6319990.1 FHS family L-fucose permease-like MFS transporter [Parabacteroides sp. PH5-13]MDH6323777.1 FHS family L-fucose permease-like MFS transporter [Parabacteroides sp. PH5-8]MDH6327667.1 FHS family L-fucose permease-like MFS transp
MKTNTTSSSGKKPLVPREFLLPFILITSLFFAWGLANNMTDTLLAAFKKIMSMTDFQTSWIQIAFYFAYFCLALPAAILIKKTTYKTGVVVGLIMFITGALLFYPCSKTMVYSHFLISLYILAGGLSVLETTANPYIILMGPEETATRRLNLAQSFNPIGSVTGVILSKFFILSGLATHTAAERAQMSAEELNNIQSGELNAVMGPYVGVAFVLIIILLLIVFTRMPKASDDDSSLHLAATLKRLLSNKKYVSGVLAQFFYVGAQITVWSFTIRYAMRELSVNEETASNFYILSLIVFIGARFIFTALMKYFRPIRLLLFAAIMAAVCCALAIGLSGYAGVISLVMVSFFMSLMFPTIYGLTITGLGEDTKIGGSGQIMAILGGAVITAIQGVVSDASGSISTSYIVPLACFLLVVLYSIYMEKKHI